VAWEISRFAGMGPIRLGMSPTQVADIIGEPDAIDEESDGYRREFRSEALPVISYQDGQVTEIEAFREVEGVTLAGRAIFGEPGLEIMRFLEEQNGSAMANVGTVLFNDIGISCGRLDESPKEDHSITVFVRGLWDDGLSRCEEVAFRWGERVV
jgi:hypothetical protein